MRRRLIAALCIILVIAAADWAVCAALMSSMRIQFKQWAETLRHQGFAVSYRTLRSSAAPWRVRLIVPGMSVSGGKAMLPGGLQWRAERLELSISLFDPGNIAVTPSGDQFLQAAGTPAIVFFAETLTASVPSGLTRLDELQVEAEGLVGGLAASPQHQDVRIENLQFTLQAARGGAARTTARLGIAARGVGLPDDGRWPLGATINRLDAELSLASPALSGDAPAEQARAWRDWGGVLTMQSLTLHWGPLDLQGAAELGLDAHLQPEGRGEARVAGWAATLDALARGGTIQPGVAQTAKAVLALMPHPAQGDAAGSSLELPFTLQDSTLSVGKIPLMRFGEVVWGGS